jgi:polyhydroxyalkanoate synthesis regulator phasin
MGATSDDLMDIARAGAERIDMPDNRVRFPSFSDIEEQCATEYDELLEALHEDELFAPADVQRQEEIVQRLKEIVGELEHELIEELVDNLARQIWLNQEAAFHLGMAVGLRLAEGRRH